MSNFIGRILLGLFATMLFVVMTGCTKPSSRTEVRRPRGGANGPAQSLTPNATELVVGVNEQATNTHRWQNTVEVNRPSPASFTVANNARQVATNVTGRIAGSGFRFKGNQAYPGEGGNCGASIQPSTAQSGTTNHCTIGVELFSDTPGQKEGQLIVTYRLNNQEKTLTIQLRGEVVAAPSNGGEDRRESPGIVPTARLILASGSSVPPVAVANDQSVPLDINIRNTSSVAQISGIAAQLNATTRFNFAGGSFPGTNGNCDRPVAANGTCTLKLVYNRTGITDEAVHTATLTINYTSGGAAGTPLVLTLTGRKAGAGGAPGVELARTDDGALRLDVPQAVGGASDSNFAVSQATSLLDNEVQPAIDAITNGHLIKDVVINIVQVGRSGLPADPTDYSILEYPAVNQILSGTGVLPAAEQLPLAALPANQLPKYIAYFSAKVKFNGQEDKVITGYKILTKAELATPQALILGSAEAALVARLSGANAVAEAKIKCEFSAGSGDVDHASICKKIETKLSFTKSLFGSTPVANFPDNKKMEVTIESSFAANTTLAEGALLAPGNLATVFEINKIKTIKVSKPTNGPIAADDLFSNTPAPVSTSLIVAGSTANTYGFSIASAPLDHVAVPEGTAAGSINKIKVIDIAYRGSVADNSFPATGGGDTYLSLSWFFGRNLLRLFTYNNASGGSLSPVSAVTVAAAAEAIVGALQVTLEYGLVNPSAAVTNTSITFTNRFAIRAKDLGNSSSNISGDLLGAPQPTIKCSNNPENAAASNFCNGRADRPVAITAGTAANTIAIAPSTAVDAVAIPADLSGILNQTLARLKTSAQCLNVLCEELNLKIEGLTTASAATDTKEFRIKLKRGDSASSQIGTTGLTDLSETND